MRENFYKKINKNTYQIFLFSCPAVIPLSFLFNHSWFVCVKDGLASRWEVRFEKNKKTPEIGLHLHKNTLDPFVGTGKIAYVPNKFFWEANLIKYIEGDKNSLAHKMYDFIENSDEKYKYRNNYFVTGPNCNTYVKWVLNHFPEFNIKLSWRFIGRRYKNL